MYYIGVDIGGTGIKTGIVKDDYTLIDKSSIPTDKSFDYKVIVKDIAKQIGDLIAKNCITLDEVGAIGIGCPGAINSEKGTVDYANNLHWEEVPLAPALAQETGKIVKISNDANVAALGETKCGAGKKYHDTILVTLGTGVGGGVVIENKLFEGFESKGTELGHMVIVRDGEQCSCGRKGCLEAYASATALIRDTKRAMEKDKNSLMWKFSPTLDEVDGRTSFECAKQGDASAQKVVDEYIAYLGEGVSNFVNIFRPQAILLGGGVCAQGEYLTKPLKKFVHEHTYGGKNIPEPEILIATLGNNAGIIGAASLVIPDKRDV